VQGLQGGSFGCCLAGSSTSQSNVMTSTDNPDPACSSTSSPCCPLSYSLKQVSGVCTCSLETGGDRSSCSPTCRDYSCPVGYVTVTSATSILSPLEQSTCCSEVKVCLDWPRCPTGQVSSDREAGWSDAECCELPLCKSFACQAPMINLEGQDDLRGNDANTCCRQSCAGYQCPTGYEANETEIGSPSIDSCCIQTCNLYSCSSPGWSRKMSSPVKYGHDDIACCYRIRAAVLSAASVAIGKNQILIAAIALAAAIFVQCERLTV